MTAVKRLEQARAEIVEACDGFLRARSDSRLAHRRRAPRDPARHGAHTRRRQSPEAAVHGRRGALGRARVPGQGLPLARAGSDLRRRHPAAPRRGVSATPTARGTATCWRRSSAISASRWPCGTTKKPCVRCSARRWARPARRCSARTCTPATGPGACCPRRRRSSIGSLSIAGLAMGFWREGSGRVALSFIGEGGSSLGEWHEAINLCAVRKLPAVFCLQNNQTALSTPVPENSAARVFADKAAGYGIPGITIDGTDPGRGRRRVHLGGRSRPRGRGTGAPRARVDAHVRTRASRRHALSRQGGAAVLGISAAARRGYANREQLRVLGQARSDRALRRAGSRQTASSSAARSTT